MTTADRAAAEAMLQRVVADDLAADAPEVRRALAPFPDLQHELQALLAVREALSDSDDVEAIERAARAETTAADARLVRGVLAPERRRTAWIWPLAAVLLIGAAVLFAWPRPDDRNDRGRLAGDHPVRIDRSQPAWSIDPGVPLPPGARYLATLEVDGRTVGTEPFACPIVIPASWQTAIDRASTATLSVELPELGTRRRIVLVP